MSRPIQTPQDLGRIVRETRKRLKLTQPQLALAANVGVRFIVELEAGKSTLRLENILRVLQALGGVLSVEGMDSLIGKWNENNPHNPELAKNTDTLIPL
jgi:HTH-type transcriptional regulator/antitoxin HipB